MSAHATEISRWRKRAAQAEDRGNLSDQIKYLKLIADTLFSESDESEESDQKALDAFQEMVYASRAAQNSDALLHSSRFVGILLERLGRYKEAIVALESELPLARNSGNILEFQRFLQCLGSCFVSMSSEPSEDDELCGVRGLHYLLESLQITSDIVKHASRGGGNQSTSTRSSDAGSHDLSQAFIRSLQPGEDPITSAAQAFTQVHFLVGQCLIIIQAYKRAYQCTQDTVYIHVMKQLSKRWSSSEYDQFVYNVEIALKAPSLLGLDKCSDARKVLEEALSMDGKKGYKDRALALSEIARTHLVCPIIR